MTASDFENTLRAVGVVPVLTVSDARHAVPLTRALAGAGLSVVEVTLRTTPALEAIRLIAAEVPEAVVGAGTIRTPADIEAAASAGARFLVSPGTPPMLASAARTAPVPFLPGCATATEAMALADLGFPILKFFPASAYGGAAALKAMAAPLAGISFVPTGGIGQDNLDPYLKLPNVPAVGGSWMIPGEYLAAGDFRAIADLATTAACSVRSIRPR